MADVSARNDTSVQRIDGYPALLRQWAAPVNRRRGRRRVGWYDLAMGASSPRRYVISIRSQTGLGDHLICLAAAWRFARDTGRVLVADWRFSPYTLAAKDNLFPLCFEVLS